MGFQRGVADPCLYYKQGKESIVIVQVYVDDILIATKNADELNEIKSHLASQFKMTDMGQVSWFLGMKITWDQDRRWVKLDQKLYIENMLKKFRVSIW